MELGIKTEYCSSKINNENTTSKKSDGELIHENDIEIHDEVDSEKDKEIKKRIKEENETDDDSDVEICVEKEVIHDLPGSIRLRCIVNCAAHDEAWMVDDSKDNDVDFQLYSENIKLNHENNLKILETEKNQFKVTRKLKKSDSGNNSLLSTNKENTEKVDTEEHFALPAAKRVKYSENVNSELSTINKSSCSKDLLGPPSISDLSNASCSKSLPSSPRLLDLLSASCSKHLPDPPRSSDIGSASCSKELSGSPHSSDLVSASCSTSLPGLRSDADPDDSDSNIELRLLTDMYHKMFLHDCTESAVISEEKIEDVGVPPLDDSDYIEQLCNLLALEDDDENLQSEREDFVEDPDIVNPDIMYNIDLNEHYKLMDILVQKITETPDDVTVLDECMQLPPIPQVEHEPNVFTEEERLMFFNGISEYEYDIDRDDWNKIMVKRAVVFTAHAGFNIANEESLYVLAELAIEYIKNLAVVMKKNFDIQSSREQLNGTDPINISLQEIGVEGGVREVINHYTTDIFGRRDKLMKKCQHLQKVIDQYIEQMQVEKTQDPCLTKEESEAENSTNEVILENQENVSLEEIDDKTELPTEEVNTEVQSIIEEVKIESQPILEEDAIPSTENEQTESIFFDDTTEIEINMDANSVDGESINTEMSTDATEEPIDRKIDDTRVVEPKIINIDLLKPIPLNSEIIYEKLFDGQGNREELLAKWESSFDESFSERNENKNLLDIDAVKRIIQNCYQTEIEQHDESSMEHGDVKEFNDNFQNFKASPVVESTMLSSDVVLTQTDENLDVLTPIQTVIVSDNSKKVETSPMNNTTHNIPNIGDPSNVI